MRAHLGNYQVGELRFFIELDTGGAPNEEINIWLDNEIIRSVKEAPHRVLQIRVKNICRAYAREQGVPYSTLKNGRWEEGED